MKYRKDPFYALCNTEQETVQIADALASEVKIEDLEHENIQISVSYDIGHVGLTGRVKCFDSYCWVGNGDNGLTLTNGTILKRIGIANDNDYSQGYRFRTVVQ